jgi:hypothetical protein
MVCKGIDQKLGGPKKRTKKIEQDLFATHIKNCQTRMCEKEEYFHVSLKI